MIGFVLESSRDDNKAGMSHGGTLSLSRMQWFNGRLLIDATGKNTRRPGSGIPIGEQDGKTTFSLALELDEETLSNLLIAIAKRKEGGVVRLTKAAK